MKRFLGIILLVIILVFSGCGIEGTIDGFGDKITNIETVTKDNPRYSRGEKDFSKAKRGELKASTKGLKENQTSQYNSSGLATALLKYKEV